MPTKKKKTTIKSKAKKTNPAGLAKFATLTSKSISKAYSSYKKNQEIKKIKEIKLKKLEENNQIQKEKKRASCLGRKTSKR